MIDVAGYLSYSYGYGYGYGHGYGYDYGHDYGYDYGYGYGYGYGNPKNLSQRHPVLTFVHKGYIIG